MCADWGNKYLKDIVVEWFDKSEDASLNYFDRFIFLWIAFDAWSSNESGETHSDGVIEWLENSKMEDQFRNTLPQIDAHLKALVRQGYIESHVGKREPVRLNDPQEFCQVMKVIYRVRNNLFHGHKSPNDARDLKLVTLAYAILSPLLKRFVNSLR